MIIWISCVLFLLFLWVFWFSSKCHNYWKERGVAQHKPLFLLGDSAWAIINNLTLIDVMKKFYNSFANRRYGGVYQFLTPVLLVKDPELVKQMFIRDFDHFTDHWSNVPADIEPLWGRTIFGLKGLQWRIMRATLSPFFTSRKMRSMFVDSIEFADKYTDEIKNDINGVLEVEAKELIQCFSNDIMALVAFGVRCNSLKNRKNQLFLNGLEAFSFDTMWKNFKFFCVFMAPKLARFLRVSMFSRKVKDFFLHFLADIVKTREEHNVIRPDLIHLLMEAKKCKVTKYEEVNDNLSEGFASVEESEIGRTEIKQQITLSDIDFAAQALIFHFAGFDTLAIVNSFLLHQLTIEREIQRKLQDEIDQTYATCNGKLTYEILMNMKYIDMVVCEILRKYPPAPLLDRKCVKKYTIEPINSDEVPVELNPGDQIWIANGALLHDPKYFPNPDKFDPERFNDKNKHLINPYTFLPFGVGPRSCLGSRFALMQTENGSWIGLERRR